jgi:ribosome maturation protein SDO1
MVTVEDAIIARYTKDGKHFEILVDPTIAYDLKEGRIVSLSRMLAANIVFTDAKKGTKAGTVDLQTAFATTDVEKIAEAIVKKGELQLTTEFRRKKTEERRKQIATFISKHAINPQTKVPHPPDRILNAMDIARVNVDPFKPAEQQVEDVIKALKSVLPISMEEAELNIEVPAQFAGRAYGMLKEYNIQKEQWLANGSLIVKIAIPAGLKESIYRKINALTAGNARIVEEVKR